MSEEKKIKGVVDLVFLIDVTGSMQPCIDGLRDNIKEFFNTLQKPDANGGAPIKDWRARVVGFRDYPENPADWLEDNDFTRDVNVLFNQLDGLTASGGGDLPESMLDALYTVAKAPSCEIQDVEDPKKWRYRHNAVRAVIVFTDAPFKDPMSAPGCENGTVDDVITAVMESRMRLSIVTPFRDAEGNEIDCMNTLAEADNTEYIPLKDQDGNSLALDRFSQDRDCITRLLQKLAKTLTKSVRTELL